AGTDFAGNVIPYGVGLSYFIVGQPQIPGQHVEGLAVAPVIEFVGWTVLSGKEFDAGENLVKDAAGDTIINAKFGLRINYGDHNSFPVSYGRALTGTVWYKDIVRVEYRYSF